MDGASAVAGLIGLAALIGQSATKITKVVKEYKESSKQREDLWKWMIQVQDILADVKKSSIEVQNYGLPNLATSIVNLNESLHHCHEKLAELQADCAKQSHRKRLDKLKIVLSTTELERKIDEIDRLLCIVIHCCENLFRQLDLQSFPLLQKTSKQVENIAAEISNLSTTTKTLSTDNEILRKQFQAHANVLSCDLGKVQQRLDGASQISDTAMARLEGMENSIADIYGMAAVLPQEMQSIIAQTVSQTVSTAFASLQQNLHQPPLRGRILHRKIVPARVNALKSTPERFEDLDSGKRPQIDLNLRTYPYTVEQSHKIVFWKGVMFPFEVVVVLRRTQRTRVFEKYETDKSYFEIDVYAQSKSWPIAGRVYTNLLFDEGKGFSAIPKVSLTPSRFLFEDNLYIQAIKTGDIGKVRSGFANEKLWPSDIVANVSTRGQGERDLGLVGYAADHQQLEIIHLLLEQGALVDVTESALTANLLTDIYFGTEQDKRVLRTHIDITRVLLQAGSRVEDVWVTDFYKFYISWRWETLSALSPICEEYWEDAFKLVWGPHKHAHHLSGLTDKDGHTMSAVDELLYRSFILQRNEESDDLWAIRRLELALEYGARLDVPSAYGNLSLQNYMARVSWRFRDPDRGKERWMEDDRNKSAHRNILLSLQWLLQAGADPVAIDVNGQTATWLAFYCQMLPDWFAALDAHNIDMEHVARHAVAAVNQKFLDGLRATTRTPYAHPVFEIGRGGATMCYVNHWEDFDVHTVSEARELMRETFAEYGVQVRFVPEKPVEYGVVSTGADFDIPSTPKRGVCVNRRR